MTLFLHLVTTLAAIIAAVASVLACRAARRDTSQAVQSAERLAEQVLAYTAPADLPPPPADTEAEMRRQRRRGVQELIKNPRTVPPTPSAEPEGSLPLPSEESRLVLGTDPHDLRLLIERVDVLEGTREFLSIKWLDQKHFAKDRHMQRALQLGLESGVLETYELENPHDRRHKTRCCRLNRDDDTVRKVLSGRSEPQTASLSVVA